MGTITEDYVSFETAKLLKEKGFDEDIDLWYDENGKIFFEYKYEIIYNWRVRQGLKIYPRSTLQMAMKWLREVHNLKVNIFYTNSDYAIEYFDLNTQTGVGEFVFIGDGYDVYEEACETAIKYCLENLI